MLVTCEYCHRDLPIDASSCVCGACKGYMGGGVGPIESTINLMVAGAIAFALAALALKAHLIWIGVIAALFLLRTSWIGYRLFTGPIWHRSRWGKETDGEPSVWGWLWDRLWAWGPDDD